MSKNNLALLNSIIEDFTDTHFSAKEINKDQIFEIFATDVFFNKYDFSIEDIKNGLVGGKKDWGIDGFYTLIKGRNIKSIDDLDDVTLERNFIIDLYIFQYKNIESIKEDVINNFLTIAPYISDIDKKNTLSNTNTIAQEVLDSITVFHEILMKNARKFPNVNITFIHASRGDTDQIYGTSKTNESYLKKIEDLKTIILTDSLGGKTTVNYLLLGAEELKDLAQYMKSYSGDLKLNENPIFVEYGDEGVQKGYIATVYLKDYFEFLVDYDENDKPVLKEYLFESNIRDYQNNTVVNKDIEATLSDTKKENDFWWLNNGITILADEGSLVGKTFSLENIQIVNGLQTSHSIYHALKNTEYKKDKRTIFCKVIITQNKTSRDTIIKATNFQNAVPASSLRSTDIIQRDIEKYLFQKELYYDRRKNYYKNKGKPISRIISINYLSQASTAVLQSNPAKARTNPTVLTKKDEDYNLLFNKYTPIEVYYYISLLRLETEKKIKNKLKNTSNDIEKDINNYFQLHLLRIVASLITNENKVNTSSIKQLSDSDILSISESTIDTAINFLRSLLIEQYISKGDSNLANISKNSKINSEINDKITTILNN
jgi:hypothetical protein